MKTTRRQLSDIILLDRRLHGYALEEDDEQRFVDFTRHFNGVTGSIGAVCNINEHFNLRLNLARVSVHPT